MSIQGKKRTSLTPDSILDKITERPSDKLILKELLLNGIKVKARVVPKNNIKINPKINNLSNFLNFISSNYMK